MDSINSILSNKNFDEPPEVSSIKKYIQEKYNLSVNILVRDKELLITVPNASLASTLRFQGPEIKRRCQIIEKRLIFRIG